MATYRYAGEESFNKHGDWLPLGTIDAVQEFRVSIKGPLSTPVGGGIRSLNVTLRQVLDLYACIRPVRYFEGVGNPMKQPQKLNVVIFRENTEDVYIGIEWKAGSDEARKLREYIQRELGKEIREDSALAIKRMSEFGSRRLVEMAFHYALQRNLPSVTLVHNGNIMKFTAGAFRDWGYEVARETFADCTVTEADLSKGGAAARADAAPVGGLGMAPGGNVGDGLACFEATHGTAPKYANQDKVNASSVVLSGVMMLEYMGWPEAEALIVRGVENAIKSKRVTYDLARQMPGATEVSTSAFGDQIIRSMPA